MGILSFFSGGKNKRIKEALLNNAIILDVRTKGEFQEQNTKGSVNIPLDRLESDIKRLKKINRPIMVCCATGMRSASAVAYLKSQGIKNVFNAGSWRRVDKIR